MLARLLLSISFTVHYSLNFLPFDAKVLQANHSHLQHGYVRHKNTNKIRYDRKGRRMQKEEILVYFKELGLQRHLRRYSRRPRTFSGMTARHTSPVC
jgi:hypothetical protein